MILVFFLGQEMTQGHGCGSVMPGKCDESIKIFDKTLHNLFHTVLQVVLFQPLYQFFVVLGSRERERRPVVLFPFVQVVDVVRKRPRQPRVRAGRQEHVHGRGVTAHDRSVQDLSCDKGQN